MKRLKTLQPTLQPTRAPNCEPNIEPIPAPTMVPFRELTGVAFQGVASPVEESQAEVTPSAPNATNPETGPGSLVLEVDAVLPVNPFIFLYDFPC